MERMIVSGTWGRHADCDRQCLICDEQRRGFSRGFRLLSQQMVALFLIDLR